MRVDLWTIQDKHIVYENVNLYRLSKKERFVIIEHNKGKSIEYFPSIDILRVRLTKTRKSRKAY